MSQRLARSAAIDAQAISVVTRVVFPASPAQVWKGIIFYEEIDRRPPLHLRVLLPVPLRTEGHIAEVGDEATCLYERGRLRKRLTRIERDRLYEFEVAEQALSFRGGIRLSGGGYTLRELPDGQTDVSVETRYFSFKAPRWFWEPLERIVCRSFHRYLMNSMHRKIESL
jgi:hypothetical protein